MEQVSPRESLRVLVVDDDQLQLTVIRAWLESAGHRVFTHDGPLGTSSIIRRERPDVVLLDMVMPGLNGDALGRLITKDPGTHSVGIVFYSAQDPERLRDQIGNVPMLGAIRKTHDGEAFLNQFHRLTARSGPSSRPPRRSQV